MSQNSNRIIGALVAVAAVGAVVAGVLLAKPAADLDPGTPQGVVQGYLKAALNRDATAALTYLDPSSGCTAKSFDNIYIPDNPEVSLVKDAVNASSATVDVKVSYSSGGILGSNGSELHTYRLIKGAAGWRIANVPWPLYDCGLVK